MFNNRIEQMLREETAVEWNGFNDGEIVEETVHFADGSTLTMTLELGESEGDEGDEDEENDYVMVGGSNENPVLVHKDILDVYIECMSEDELKKVVDADVLKIDLPMPISEEEKGDNADK